MENKTMKELYRELHPYLAHYGVLGMKWGVRRFQPYSLIPRKSGEKGKEVGAAKKSKSKGSEVKKTLNKVKVSEVKKSRTQKSKDAKKEYAKKANTVKQREAELNKIIKSGDARAIYEHKSEMSTTQLKSAIERLNTEATLKSIVSEQNTSTIKKLKNLTDKVNDANDIVKTGINTYKTLSDVKDLGSKADKARKEAASAKVLKDIIGDEGPINPYEVARLGAKLSNKDYSNLTKRLRDQEGNLDTVRKYNERKEKADIRKEREFIDAKSRANSDIDKYGATYTRDLISKETGNKDYADKVVKSVLEDRAQDAANKQAANRHTSKTKYDDLQEKRKRTNASVNKKK